MKNRLPPKNCRRIALPPKKYRNILVYRFRQSRYRQKRENRQPTKKYRCMAIPPRQCPPKKALPTTTLEISIACGSKPYYHTLNFANTPIQITVGCEVYCPEESRNANRQPAKSIVVDTYCCSERLGTGQKCRSYLRTARISV